jgi:hypothetical protein
VFFPVKFKGLPYFKASETSAITIATQTIDFYKATNLNIDFLDEQTMRNPTWGSVQTKIKRVNFLRNDQTSKSRLFAEGSQNATLG